MKNHCEICDKRHDKIEVCHFFEDEEEIEQESLAIRTLPNWIFYHPSPEKVIANKRIKKRTKFGPVLAPFTSKKPSSDFPLKVVLSENVNLWLNLSDKSKCCWLSLIPVSKEDHNLSSCQIGESIFYVSLDDIPSGSELKVWYAPFYKDIEDSLKTHSNTDASKDSKSPHANTISLRVTKFEEKTNKFDVLEIGSQDEANRLDENINHQEPPSKEIYQSFYSNPAQLSTSFCSFYSTIPPCLTSLGASLERSIGDQEINFSKFSTIISPENNANSIIASKEIVNSVLYNSSLEKDNVNVTVSKNVSQASIPAVSLKNIKKIHASKEKIIFEFNSCKKIYPLNIPQSPFSSTFSPQNSLSCVSVKVYTNDANKEDKPQNIDAEKRFTTIKKDDTAHFSTGYVGKGENQDCICLQCNYFFTSDVQLASHLKEHLLFILKKIYFCKDCKDFVSSSNYSHLQYHLGHAKGQFKLSLASSSKRKNSTMKRSTWSLPPPQAMSYLNCTWIGNFNCQICDKKFDKAQYLLRHLSKHSADFSCNLCEKIFARKASLLKHNDQIHTNQNDSLIKESKLRCEKCNIEFFQLRHYKEHLLKHEGNAGSLNFKKSATRFQPDLRSMNYFSKFCTKSSLQHIKDFQLYQKMNYQCEYCKQKYSLKRSFDDHVMICKQIAIIEEKGEVDCFKCGHTCKSSAELRLHYQSHTHPYSCLICFHKFKSRGTYEQHICSENFLCDKCEESFRSIQGLSRHLSMHDPPLLSCTSCQYPFYRKESLAKHKCKVQINEALVNKKDFACSKCLSHFSSKYSLELHLSSVHNMASKRFACGKCEKRFHRTDLLKDHERTHMGPLLSCPQCSKSFKDKTALRVHSTVHREDYRFLCRYCNKGFSQKTNLLRHEKSHTPVGSVKCQHCGLHCRSTKHLETHLLNHADIQPSGSLQKKHTVVNIGELVQGRSLQVTKKMETPLSLPIGKLASFPITEISATSNDPSIIHKFELAEQPTVFLTSLSLAPISHGVTQDERNIFPYEESIDLKIDAG